MASSVTGLSRTQAAMRRLTPAMVENITAAVEQGARDVEARAKAVAPRDTGDMVSAIEVRENLEGFKATGAIGNFAKQLSRAGQGIQRFIGVFPQRAGDKGWYAAWVEYGTTKNAAKPFLLPSFISQRKQIEGRIKRAVNKAIRQVARGGGNG